MESKDILKVKLLPNELHQLVEESINDGFRHLIRLVNEFQAGTNRFDKQGEALFIAYAGNQIVGICGLNQDPNSQEGSTGRVRRLYVSKDFRGLGIGRLLIGEVIKEARIYYRTLVLRTDNPIADKFYCSLGFEVSAKDVYITHYLQLVKYDSI
ncbi:GNAT family N-acetyltransferase [Paenibacillus sp. N3.4]|nr:GNAT family N-acetyltransferase [Paenibacillus sp. N3.4]